MDVLRLDLVHPVVSGNKWYKLKAHLQKAREQGKSAILTFGGAYSNHILATAAACSAHHLKSIGIIRGEISATPSPTLQDAAAYGMQLIHVSREEYRAKKIPELLDEQDYYMIPEGGYGPDGITGITELLCETDLSIYSHIMCAVGTGTTLAGIIHSMGPEQQAVGISVMKNNNSLQEAVKRLIPDKEARFKLIHEYHCGGYARYTKKLVDFMNEWYLHSGIPTDFVYTGKLFMAIHDLLDQGLITEDNSLLVVHSGGLQGNRSLPKGTLIF